MSYLFSFQIILTFPSDILVSLFGTSCGSVSIGVGDPHDAEIDTYTSLLIYNICIHKGLQRKIYLLKIKMALIKSSKYKKSFI